MKPTNILLALSLVLASSLASHAQVGIGTATPAASSILDLTSTTQGLLAPRMTEAQRTAIASPENGLIVYQTDGNVGLWVYNTSTSSWTLSTAANTAATVTNVAAGTIAAVNVQGALDELDLEKAPIASPTFTGTVTAPTFVGDLTGNVTGDLTGNAATATLASTVTNNADLSGAVVSTGNTTSLGAFSSADLEGALSDETGTGVAVFATSPTLVTPIIGTLGTAVTAIIMNSQSAVPNTSIVSGSTTEVTYSVNNVLAGATALVSFDHALYPGIYVAYTRTTVSNVIVGYGNATNTNQILSANATTNIKITVIQ